MIGDILLLSVIMAYELKNMVSPQRVVGIISRQSVFLPANIYHAYSENSSKSPNTPIEILMNGSSFDLRSQFLRR
jgi:hypothetical protein